MKTNKFRRGVLREVCSRSANFTGPQKLNPPPVMVDLLDDLDLLEKQLEIAVNALKFFHDHEAWADTLVVSEQANQALLEIARLESENK